jgi:Domain of unknown function (DUF4132)
VRRDELHGLDELGAARLAEGRVIVAELLSGCQGLSAGVIAEPGDNMAAALPSRLEGPAGRPFEEQGLPERMARLSAEQLRCVLFALAERLAGGWYDGDPEPRDWFCLLSQMPLSLAAGDVRLLAAVAEPGTGWLGFRPFELVVQQVETLLAAGAPGAGALADTVADQVLDWNAMVYHWHDADGVLRASPAERRERDLGSGVARLRDRALELAGRPPALPALEGPVSRDDGWGLAVLGWLGVIEDWPPGAATLLEHCATARTPRPGPRWDKTGRQRLDGVADPGALLRRLLDTLLSAEPVSYLTDSGPRTLLVGFNEQLIKGIVWAAGLLDPPWLPQVLGAVAARCLRLCSGHVFGNTAVQGEKIPYACFRALVASGSDASLLALARTGQATANGSVLKNLAKALEEAASRRGTSPASLLDRLTPDHGIGVDGRVSIGTQDGRWTIRLDDRDGAAASGPPGAVAPPPVSQAVAEIKATVRTVRQRLEALFTEQRQWHADDFADCYLRHPLAGWLADRLAWTFIPEDGSPAVRGFPDRATGGVRTPAGTVPVPLGCLVQLVHPVTLDAGNLAALRRLCEGLEIRQPARQLWRETYQLTAAERDTGLYTERYRGHILRFAQAYGLARRRGWAGGFLSGAWDGGDTAAARRDYPAAGLRASWAIARLDDLSREAAVDLCSTERAWFSPLDDAVMTPVPLEDVPAEVFSEAMRDLDLVVSVTTVANDPAWLEEYRGQPVIDQYWERIARGGLDQLRTHRREILAPFCAGPASQRYQLTDRELIVTGSLASYRIDLATANVRTKPAGKWLSFDTRTAPPADYPAGIPGLPALDDDEILQRILIRAAILADDEQLASRKILKQIRG